MEPDTTRRRRPAGATDRRSESANALALVPAMVLVMLCLGGLAIDLSLLHGAHRSAHRIVSAAADDAAAMLDDDALQRSGELRIDPDGARRVAAAQVASMRLPGRLVDGPEVELDPDRTTVTVTVVVEVDRVMLRALPGRPASERVRVSASARLNR